MRHEKEVLKEVTEWASKNARVKTLILTGSRANPKTTKDIFSDYDIEIGADNLKEFLNNEKWLLCFGKVLTMISEDHDNYSMRLVLYKDYVRIDFKIYAVTYFDFFIQSNQLPAHWDNGYKILVDKDGVVRKLKPPAYDAFIIKKPTEDEFLSVVNDFWWDTTYVAKSLWRDELFDAKYMLDSIIRFSYLQPMIEWNIGLQNNWQVTTNKRGRFFKQHLNAETLAKLEATFSASSIEENWKSLFATTALFSQLARSFATELHYSYPEKTVAEIMGYLVKIKNLTRDATDIE